MNFRKLHIAAAVMLLAGCTVGPNFVKPDASVPKTWCTSACDATQAEPSHVSAQPANPAWWTSFNDPELVKLENQVANANLDLKMASLRLEESRETRTITAADQYPSVQADASVTRQQTSANGELAALSPELSKGEPPINVYQAGFDASWELDLWGAVRRQVEAADASVDIQAEERRDLLLSTMAEVARDYIQLRGTQSDYAITLNNLNTAKDIERVTREENAHGLASGLDVSQAAAQVSSEAAQLPQLQQQEAETINRLSFLLGEAPGTLRAELETAQPIPPTPPVVPIGVPSELARRRPDIREAEANLHQATAEIGVAKAAFYPTIMLSGSANMQALAFSQLGDWGSHQFSIGPSISLPIFEGGRLKGTLNLRKLQQQEAAIKYQSVVLSAWHEIDNSLTQYASQQQRRDQLQAAVTQDQNALRLARAQYTAGTGTYLQMLDAQRTLLAGQQDLNDNVTGISTTLVSLYKGLGGGWESTYPDVASAGNAPSAPDAKAAAGEQTGAMGAVVTNEQQKGS